VLPNNLTNWKKQFLENAEIAMDPAGATKEYKEQILQRIQEIAEDEFTCTYGENKVHQQLLNFVL